MQDIELALLDRETQLSGQTTTKKMSVGKAVQDGIIDNETLGYFLARISLFLKKIGIDLSKVRFRQHMVSSQILLQTLAILTMPGYDCNYSTCSKWRY